MISMEDCTWIILDFFRDKCDKGDARIALYRAKLETRPLGTAIFEALPHEKRSKIRGTRWDLWDVIERDKVISTLSYLS